MGITNPVEPIGCICRDTGVGSRVENPMVKRTKDIYRDKATGRLITQAEAETRDPSTYVREGFSRPKALDQTLWRRDMPTVEDEDD